jgi:hypothetical protein
MFRYSARTGSLARTESSKEAEAERIAWLEQYLAENKYCPSGYIITERKPVVIGDLMGPLYRIYYTGLCKDRDR